jgi:hypothetical protein
VIYQGLVRAPATLHETMHQWGLYLDRSLELDDGTGHWGAVNIPGTLYGLDFKENGDGTYTILRNGSSPVGDIAEYYRQFRYPPMELYLMGLIPPEQVPPITVLRGIDPARVNPGDVVRPTSVRTVTIQEIIAAHGPRIPDHRTSPKRFRMAGILLTPGRFATEAEMAYFARIMEYYGSNETGAMRNFGNVMPSFGFATGGRAQLDTVVGPPR